MWQSLILVLLFSAIAAAEVQIIDNSGTLERLSQLHRGHFSFEQAFVCGSEETFRADTTSCQYKCGTACASRCNDAITPVQKKFVFAVEECSSDRVMVYGDNGFAMEVLKSDYEAGGNSLVIPLLKAHGFFLTPEAPISLEMLMSQMVKVIANGREESRFASVVVAAAGMSTRGQGFNLEVVFFPEEPGLRSLAMLRNAPNNHFLRRNDVRKTIPGMDF